MLGIGKNIKKQLGKRMTPAGLQEAMNNKARPKVYTGTRTSLSKRFEQYSKLIGGSNTASLSDIAAEIYLDTSAVVEWIDVLDAQIEQQKTWLELVKVMPGPTPEMIEIVTGVNAVIFGEDDYGSDIPDTVDEPWVSPLAK